MDSILGSLGQWIATYPAWTHWIIAGGMVIQGEITIFVSIYLVLNNTIGWSDFLGPAIASVILVDTFLYIVGRSMRNTRFGWRLYRKMKQSRKNQSYLYYARENTTKMLVGSKFLFGTNIVAMLAIGWAKIKPGRFFQAELIGVLSWFSGITLIAYFMDSGLHYLQSENIFKQAELLIAAGAVIVIGGEYILKKIAGKIAATREKVADLANKINGKEEYAKEDEEEEERRLFGDDPK
jgi:membrane protein DedA with SNARE-associated domain